jgi:hypothetical protein
MERWELGFCLKTPERIASTTLRLLASQVADDYLWQEIVRNHGCDVLPKPAMSERVISLSQIRVVFGASEGKSGTFGSK